MLIRCTYIFLRPIIIFVSRLNGNIKFWYKRTLEKERMN